MDAITVARKLVELVLPNVPLILANKDVTEAIKNLWNTFGKEIKDLFIVTSDETNAEDRALRIGEAEVLLAKTMKATPSLKAEFERVLASVQQIAAVNVTDASQKSTGFEQIEQKIVASGNADRVLQEAVAAGASPSEKKN